MGELQQVDALILGVTSDLVAADGTLAFPNYPFEAFQKHPSLSIRHVAVNGRHQPSDLADLDVLISVPHGAPIDAAAIQHADRLFAILRVGVGYEDCDVDALTRAGIALAVPRDATRRPTAVAALTLLLALATRLLEKHRMTCAGPDRWDSRADLQGLDLRGKQLGLVGCGAIGAELINIAKPLGLSFAISDPALDASAAAAMGADLLPLDDLLRSSDFVSLHCPLSAETRHLIDGPRLSLMKRSAYLINTARGGVVDQRALVAALEGQQIAGAGLDVFEPEPLPANHPLLRLESVILSGHALNWTRELDAVIGQLNFEAVTALLDGEPPNGIVNPAVLKDPQFQRKLNRLIQCRSRQPNMQEKRA